MDTKFIRRGRNIETINEKRKNTIKSFPSFNQAKKESHRLQNMNGGLGMGSLIVE